MQVGDGVLLYRGCIADKAGRCPYDTIGMVGHVNVRREGTLDREIATKAHPTSPSEPLKTTTVITVCSIVVKLSVPVGIPSE